MSDRGLSRREFLKLAGAGAAMALPGAELFAADEKKPNVIVILSDDHGYGSIGCQGFKEVSTPNMDSIAKNGVRCTDGYVTCPVCSPTRAGLMTGRYQQRFGHEDNPGPPTVCAANFGLPESEKTMGDYMKAQGYVTGVIGKWHLGHRPECHPQKRGFDEFFGFLTGAHSYTKAGVGTLEPIYRGTKEVDEKEYLTDAFAREAVSFIECHKEKPFFLYIPFNAVHVPFEMPERYKDSYSEITFPNRRIYAGMLKALDDAVGRILAAVRNAGAEENTLIFFLGDNGGYRLGGESLNTPLNGFKGDTFEGGVRVPFMVQWKGKLPAGKVYDKPVVSLDILPTAVALAGGKVAANVEGVNLLPYLKGDESKSLHDRLFWRWCQKSGARVGDWKLVRNGDGTEKLFNLADDISEKNDLASTNPEKLKELQAAYQEWDSKNIPPKWIDGRKPKA